MVVKFNYATTTVGAASFPDGQTLKVMATNQEMRLEALECPNCGKLILRGYLAPTGVKVHPPVSIFLDLYPSGTNRPVPVEVPKHIATMYHESEQVMPISEEASAAISRRCLQTVLVEAGKSNRKELADQITEVLPSLPYNLQQQLDAVRNIGNFGAHPTKSQVTGAIVEVEVGEATWNLDVLDLLFDHYYVQQAKIDAKRQALNKKLAEHGKPPMK